MADTLVLGRFFNYHLFGAKEIEVQITQKTNNNLSCSWFRNSIQTIRHVYWFVFKKVRHWIYICNILSPKAHDIISTRRTKVLFPFSSFFSFFILDEGFEKTFWAESNKEGINNFSKRKCNPYTTHSNQTNEQPIEISGWL